MSTIRFSNEIRTQKPPGQLAWDQKQFLLVGDEICFADPKTLGDTPYTADFEAIEKRMKPAANGKSARFGDEFRKGPPAAIGQNQFLLVGDEIRFVDPLSLGDTPYTSDLKVVAQRVQTVVFAEHQRLHAPEKGNFILHMQLLNRQIEQHNRAIEADVKTAAWTICLMSATKGKFDYRTHISIEAIGEQN